MTFTAFATARQTVAVAAAAMAVLGWSPVARADQAQPTVQVAQAGPSWIDPKLLADAKKEGSFTLYGSMNEEEALPLLKLFENSTGLKTEYVRNSDTGLMARIMVEARANKQSWDALQTTTVSKMPEQLFVAFDPPEAKNVIPEARGPNKKWYGVYANYNSPGYNTKLVKKEDLPKTYEDFLSKKDWVGKVAIDFSDREWLRAMYEHYGDAKAKKLVDDLIKTLKVATTNGHLALARSVGAGEYAVELNNYTNLIVNVKLAGGPTDFWVVDPVVVFFGQIGVNAKAPHPNAARLFANFMLSPEGQKQLTTAGRIPTRPDVETNPPGVLKAFEGHKLRVSTMTSEEDERWQKLFKETFSQPR
ncbi:MAG: ABC transporter substrate-binding protein [Gemmatimonas sp.]